MASHGNDRQFLIESQRTPRRILVCRREQTSTGALECIWRIEALKQLDDA
jgi:hypothetical protein